MILSFPARPNRRPCPRSLPRQVLERHICPGIPFLIVLLLASGHAQLAAQYIFSPQQSQYPAVDCSDPTIAATQSCQTVDPRTLNSAAAPAAPTTRGTIDSEGQNIGRDVYLDSAGFPVYKQSPTASQRKTVDPVTDFQRLVKRSTNEFLPIFGRDLFVKPPSTFAPEDQSQVNPDYVVGPGDQIVVRVWGHNTFNGRLTVDRSGTIYVPQVGAIHVAGLRYNELHDHIQQELNRAFRNFELSVDLGQLRSIQVYVLGEALHPGSYTVSSLATAFNALLVSGGPTVNGSMRSVEVRRAGQRLTTVDLYDFILHGDKSKDATLQAGDVIFIPVVSAQVAVSGSVHRPAIYEVLPETKIKDLLQLAGGLSTTAAADHISIERIEDRHQRQAMTVKLDPQGMSTVLADGDVLHVDSMLGSYKDSVTIRGNLANAGRFTWRPGLKLSDIIPDRDSLLTNDYWLKRNRLGIPTPLFASMESSPLSGSEHSYNDRFDVTSRDRTSTRSFEKPNNPSKSQASDLPDSEDLDDSTSTVRQPNPGDLSQRDQLELARRSEQSMQTTNNMVGTESSDLDRSSLADQQLQTRENLREDQPKTTIRIPTPEIDWSYAVIERLDPQTLKSSLLPFNLGRLVIEHDATQDLPLQPGDIITILSQSDIPVSQDERTKYVRLEGEFASSGVYSVGPNETLIDVVRHAGGFTPKAYLFGATFSRESARVMQQSRLNEYVSQLSIQMERASAVRAVSSNNPLTGGGSLDGEKSLIRQLRSMRATGRIVLEFKPDSAGLGNLPPLPIENGDVFRVPSRPLVVSVVGAVYGPNVFLYDPARKTRDYLKLAGKTNRVADRSHAFIIRADGSIFSKETTGGLWSDHFDTASIYPGDTIVVPEKPIKPSALRDVIDWSQVFSQFALGAAAINVVR